GGGKIAEVEIFGPVLVSMTFRTPKEAVELANNTRYGLAASVWSENINLALDVASKLKAGTVWINSTNLFDAASGFGGYRESGYGREGGKEGLYEYVRPEWEASITHDRRPTTDDSSKANRHTKPVGPKVAHATVNGHRSSVIGRPAIDRTPKLFIGGKQARPDSGYSMTVYSASGEAIGEVGEGNRKDIRNAVEAAH